MPNHQEVCELTFYIEESKYESVYVEPVFAGAQVRFEGTSSGNKSSRLIEPVRHAFGDVSKKCTSLIALATVLPRCLIPENRPQ